MTHQDARARLDRIAHGYQDSIILLTAVQAGVFDALGEGAQTAPALAERLGLDARALETLLLALAAQGTLTLEGETFMIAPEFADFLPADGAQTQANILRHNYHIMRRWVRLDEVLRSGRPVPRPEGDAEQMRAFICGMADISRLSSLEVAERLDLSGARRLLDLGGGPGTAAITFAQRWPELQAVVFDLEGPIGIAREQIQAAALAGRVATRVGDYLRDDFGEGFDAVYISNIIHSLGPEDVALLAEKSARALTAGGRIVVKDFYLEDTRTRPAHAARFSVNMLVGTEAGKSYTLSETRRILEAAGFGAFESLDVAVNSKLLIGRRG
jgi:SAM-dependent methyltransferase